MTEATADVEAVVAGLSKTQRAALLLADRQWRTSKEIGATGGTLSSLCWFWPKGADPISPCACLLSRDYQDSPLRYIYRLTERGLAVRAHLLSETANEPR